VKFEQLLTRIDKNRLFFIRNFKFPAINVFRKNKTLYLRNYIEKLGKKAIFIDINIKL
jgi:hypothetical protein